MPTSSFPSGHIAATLCLWISIALLVTARTRHWWRWIAVALAVQRDQRVRRDGRLVLVRVPALAEPLRRQQLRRLRVGGDAREGRERGHAATPRAVASRT